MINDATLSADGLSPYWRLTDGAGNSLTGYDWSQAGVHPVGGGSQKYNVTYAPPAGIYSWTLEMCETLVGGTAAGVTSAAINVAPPVAVFDVQTTAPSLFLITGEGS